jgi:hypothetical protein
MQTKGYRCLPLDLMLAFTANRKTTRRAADHARSDRIGAVHALSVALEHGLSITRQEIYLSLRHRSRVHNYIGEVVGS